MPRSRKHKIKAHPESASEILRKVAPQESFLFFTDISQYTGELAQSLEEFYDKTSKVPLESLDFHSERGDFEKWIRETLGDDYLADRISRINKSVRKEKLRATLKRVVKRRLNQLLAEKD